MFYRRHVDKLLIPIILGLLFVVASYRGKNHLRSEMPAAFFAENRGSSQSAIQRQIAGAYWNAARSQVQWRYAYGQVLPADPPPEFQIKDPSLGVGAEDPAVRMLYWHRLQEVWYLPEAWKKDYEWDVTWVGDPLTSAANWIKEETRRIFHD